MKRQTLAQKIINSRLKGNKKSDISTPILPNTKKEILPKQEQVFLKNEDNQ